MRTETAPPESVELMDSSDLDLRDLWRNYGPRDWEMFVEYLKRQVNDPEFIDDELSACEYCGAPDWRDDLTIVKSGVVVCDTCLDGHYRKCDCCDEYVRTGSTYCVANNDRICDSCMDSDYFYCDYCDTYFPNDAAGEHNHYEEQGNDCCESPALSFVVRNDGADPLPNDTRVTITLPAGEISPEGIEAIRRLIRSFSLGNVIDEDYDKCWSLYYAIPELGNKWQTKEGNFTKRLSRLAYKGHGLKLPPDVISAVGNIASDHSRPVSFGIETSRKLNQSAADWYHEDSCWWQSFYYSRCTLKTNGGYGIRSYDDNGHVSGRAWVLPLRKDEHGKLLPTFNTETPNAFVVFNGYGALSGYTPARIVAHMAGFTYRKIEFSFGQAFVNGGSAYLVAPEDIASKYTDGRLLLNLAQHSNLFESEHANASV